MLLRLPRLTVALATLLPLSSCITRAGMNADCMWPPEAVTALNLDSRADIDHLVTDAELIEELVDRYRLHPPDEQHACQARLIDAVARLHAVEPAAVRGALKRTAQRGLDPLVTVPVMAVFITGVIRLVQVVERRFSQDRGPRWLAFFVASCLSGIALAWTSEFCAAVVQMIRVGSHHVGGRVDRLFWARYQLQIAVAGLVLFWVVVAMRKARGRAW